MLAAQFLLFLSLAISRVIDLSTTTHYKIHPSNVTVSMPLVQAFELAESLDRAQSQALSMGQSPTQLLPSTTFDPQRDDHGERPKASFSYPADYNINHSPPSCPSTAVAQRRVNKEVDKK